MDAQLKQELFILHEQVCHALGDPKRLMILYALANGPRFVNDIADELEIPQSTVSRHLKILRERALVEAARQGPALSYTLTDESLIQTLDLLRAILRTRIERAANVIASQPADAGD